MRTKPNSSTTCLPNWTCSSRAQGLIFVPHVNDDGKTRGSRNISKIAHTWIHLDRNVVAETEDARNITYLTVRKNRFAHRTGPAGVLVFDPSTYIVSERGVLPT